MTLSPKLLLVLALAAGPATRGAADPAVPSVDASRAAPAVSRNQSVLLVASADGIRLSAPGRALRDGRAGETIPVLNTATRMALKGVVRDGWIEIEAPGEPTHE